MSGEGWPYLLVPFIPIAVILDVAGADALMIFAAAVLGVVPTAALMGKATDELADRSGPGIGGLLNVTFGNAPELIIACFALGRGLQEVVKASLVGSVLSNVLLVLGASMFFGGLRHSTQRFDPRTAGIQASMLLIASIALIMPAVFQLVQGGGLPLPKVEAKHFSHDLEMMSVVVALILLSVYIAGLWFSLRTHSDLFNPVDDSPREGREPWTVRRSVSLLAIAGLAVAGMSEILVSSIEDASHKVGLSPFFVSLIVVAIAGNAAEHWVAVFFARRDKMDLSVNIAVGSAAQIALFVAPALVLLSLVVGPFPLALVFNGFEVAGVLLAVLITIAVTRDGRSTWFDGLQLLAVYATLGVVFFFV
jgi:Ca2+:H+ antiporter